MKPKDQETTDQQDDSVDNVPPVTGDVIGDTAYSERFVLKILLKFANLDTLKDEIPEKSFEDDLCTLWDMTAERDVVLFLQKHNVLNLFSFALPAIESPRIIEIIIGIIGNMCCQKEVVSDLLKRDNFVMDYLKSDDSLILIQVLRLINSSLFLASQEDIKKWMDLFKAHDYSTTLYFMLKNSSNKALLVTALETLNTICSYCNTEAFTVEFFTYFVTSEAVESLAAAFIELTINQAELFDQYDLERILVISLQILLNYVGFDKSLDLYADHRDYAAKIVSKVLSYYENKLVDLKEIDTDFVDVVESSNTIIDVLQLSEHCDPDKFFQQTYSMWQAAQSMGVQNKNGSDFEEDISNELRDFSEKIRPPLSSLLCSYIDKCTESNLQIVLDDISKDYDEIVGLLKSEELRASVKKRTLNYRTRLKENVDS